MKSRGYERFLNLPPAELALLRERARELARSQREADVGEQLELLDIRSRGQVFSLPLPAVDGIVELGSIAVVPRAPPFVRGLVSFRGEVLIGIELSALVGGAEAGFADLRRVVAVSAGGRKVGILAEKLLSVRRADASSFHADSLGQKGFVIGIDGSFSSLVDPAGLIELAFSKLVGRA